MLYAVLYLAVFTLASAVVPMSTVRDAVYLTLIALIPAGTGLAFNYHWAYLAVGLLLLPGLAQTLGGLGNVRSPADAVLAGVLLIVPLASLVLIVWRTIRSLR